MLLPLLAAVLSLSAVAWDPERPWLSEARLEGDATEAELHAGDCTWPVPRAATALPLDTCEVELPMRQEAVLRPGDARTLWRLHPSGACRLRMAPPGLWLACGDLVARRRWSGETLRFSWRRNETHVTAAGLSLPAPREAGPVWRGRLARGEALLEALDGRDPSHFARDGCAALRQRVAGEAGARERRVGPFIVHFASDETFYALARVGDLVAAHCNVNFSGPF